MAEIVWTDPALEQLDEIAEYIALDNPAAASNLVKKVFAAVERLQFFPESGHKLPEVPDSIYRELFINPCRLFYRQEGDTVFIVYIMTQEQQLRRLLLDVDFNN